MACSDTLYNLIFAHWKLCLATATHNFTWVKNVDFVQSELTTSVVENYFYLYNLNQHILCPYSKIIAHFSFKLSCFNVE